MADTRTFVIIGAALAGAKAAEALREFGFEGRVLLIGDEIERPYERPPLSKGYMLGTDPLDTAFVQPAEWYPENDIELLLGRRATALDPAAHTVTLDGHQQVRYDRLLLATGARVRTLDVPGAELEGVRYLRTMDHAEAILAHLHDAARVVIVGAGWIGLEVAAAARNHGADVTVVTHGSAPLQRVLGDEMAGYFAALHRAHGVRFQFESEVRRFLGEDGRLTTVALGDESMLPADLAVVGIGVQPATELAGSAGLAVDDGVSTDAGLRTSDPDIFACGDVASWEHPLVGRRIRVEHWANARSGGQAAARAMLGEPVAYDPMPYFFTDQYDLGMEYTGLVEPGGYDRVVFRGEPVLTDGRVPGFLAFWVRDGRVLAGMNVNVWEVTDAIGALVRAGHSGTRIDPARLADAAVPLGDLLR